MPIACQNCKTKAPESNDKRLSSIITGGYTTDYLVLILVDRFSCVCLNNLMSHIVPPWMTHFVARHISIKRSKAIIHYVVNLLYCLLIIIFLWECYDGHCQNSSGYFSSSRCSLHTGRTDVALLGQYIPDSSRRVARNLHALWLIVAKR